MQKVFKKLQPHHFILCCCTDREKACCRVKVLDLLSFCSPPSCGPPQSSCFRIFYISHCLGLSDGNHRGQVFILLTNERYPEKMWTHGGERQNRMKWRRKESENDVMVFLRKAREIQRETV